MERFNVHLTKKQIEALDCLSSETGLSKSELIRRAIDEYLEQDHSLIRELSLALETCDRMNMAGEQWSLDSDIQRKIDELLIRVVLVEGRGSA